MDTFRNWFKKKPATEADATQIAPDVEEPRVEAAETSLEEAREAPPVEKAAETAEMPVPEAVKKKNLFQAAWDRTVEIALTPVDPFFIKMAQGLDRTRQNLVGQVAGLFRLHKKIDAEFWEELEDILLTSDVGNVATDRILERLREVVKQKRLQEPGQLLGELKTVMGEILLGPAQDQPVRDIDVKKGRLNVILMVGVNGTGKTTSTAKLANLYKQQGLKVMLVAADTFRAAAIEQLEVWGQRLEIDVIRHKEGSDPAAVVYDAMSAARSRGIDLVIVDTAGRLHNKSNLMEELKKMRRVIQKEAEDAPHEVLLVLDATTGQNALIQAREFNQVVEVTGLVLCKLDGTAKGGIVVAIAEEFRIPVKMVGVGEGIDDLRPFEPDQFLEALFSEPPAEEPAA